MRKRQRRRALWRTLVLAACLTHLPVYGQGTRNVQDASSPSAASVQPGPYYALVIGIQNYRYLGKLQTPINDANEIAKLLHDSFGFQTKVLLDADRNQILSALVDYRKSLPANSNLLIYYAGHGNHDRDTDEAYWLPIDAQPNNNPNWISADDVTRDVRAMNAVQHVLVISDSCYSGYMTRDRDPHATIEPSSRNAYLGKMLSSKSRNLMSSGGDEPVADSGAPGHSVFAWAVLQSLRQMGDEEFTAADIFYNLIQPRVGGKSEQLPQYSWIRNSGHDAGDFVFIRQTVAQASAAVAAARPATPPPPVNRSPLPAGMDPTLADLYSRAVAGNPQAMFELGWDYDNGKFVPKDAKQAVTWYRKAADAGNDHGMANLSVMYQNGEGVEQDYHQAMQWDRKAAAAGNTNAMVGLGSMYETGHGVEPDSQQALSWYRKAAEAGNADGVYGLGHMYETGRGVGQDYQQAFSWYRKAAEAGNTNGMYGLGYLYQHGYGVGQDNQQAVSWYRKAAETGNRLGMTSMGVMYEHGFGVGQDFREAVSWYRKAADAGDPTGMAYLAEMYESGRGVEKDYQQALSLYRKAAQLGDQYAKNALQRLGVSP